VQHVDVGDHSSTRNRTGPAVRLDEELEGAILNLDSFAAKRDSSGGNSTDMLSLA
jgi:hypothetical protein